MSSGVEFEEDTFGRNRPTVQSGGQSAPTSPQYQYSNPGYGQPEATGMTGWLIRRGWVQTREGAQKILLALVAFNIIVTIIVVTYFL